MQFRLTSLLIYSSLRQTAIERKMGMRLILFSTVCEIGYLPILYIAWFKGRKKWTNLHQMVKIQPSEHFINQSVKILHQILGLRFWYPSIKFGHEINLKGLMYLVLLD